MLGRIVWFCAKWKLERRVSQIAIRAFAFVENYSLAFGRDQLLFVGRANRTEGAVAALE